MNFLAHLYLSGNNTELMIGNLIADHIQGNKFEHYSEGIKNGIYLHRKIDTFTDAHTIVKTSKRRLHKRYGHYNGIIIDIFYDYFLAKNWSNYSEIPLSLFSNAVYTLLELNFNILPTETQRLLPFMKQYDLLYNYKTLKGIESVLIGMNKRTKNRSQMDLAIEDLKKMENELENDFTLFFQELMTYCKKEL